MNDKQFLNWLHERLMHRFDVEYGTDYMIRLRSIIGLMPDTLKKGNRTCATTIRKGCKQKGDALP